MTAEVKQGYKQTEIGVIPEDWEVKTVGDISDVKTGPFGSALHEKDYVDDGTPIITVEHIGERGVEHRNLPMVSYADKIRLNAYSLRQGDIVFSRVGSVDRNALIKNEEKDWLFSGRLLRVRLNDSCIDSGYLSYHFHSMPFKQRVRNVAVGQTMASINTRILMGIKIALPPTKAEQEAIAEALSDADALIESLWQLIVKKRQIKQGAMQDLLTGKKRLPGYTKTWNSFRLGDHLVFLANGINSRVELTVNDSVRYLHYGDIHGSESPRISPDNLPTLPTEKAKSLSRLCNGDLVFADASEDTSGIGKSVEIVNADGFELVSGLHTIAVRFDKSVLADGFKAYLQYCPVFGKQLKKLAAGTKVYATNRRHVADIEIDLPSVEEQFDIASVLSDMEAEIAALESKLEKARQLKQGMMHNLLTGKIRLV